MDSPRARLRRATLLELESPSPDSKKFTRSNANKSLAFKIASEDSLRTPDEGSVASGSHPPPIRGSSKVSGGLLCLTTSARKDKIGAVARELDLWPTSEHGLSAKRC